MFLAVLASQFLSLFGRLRAFHLDPPPDFLPVDPDLAGRLDAEGDMGVAGRSAYPNQRDSDIVADEDGLRDFPRQD
jgi:hypothetical protein